MEHERYENYRRQSTTGASAKRDPNRRIRMKYSDYKKTIKTVAIATAITVSVVLAGTNMYAGTIHDRMTTGRMINDFHREYIAPETHRTNDNQHYFYDYFDIANRMEQMEDFDEGVYLLVNDIGEYQADRVLAYTDYDNFENYLNTHNYKDSDDFNKTMSKKIVLEEEIENKNNEIRNMLQDHTVTPQDTTYGGNK